VTSPILPALAELEALPNWVCWRRELNSSGTKHTKVPFQPTGRRASWTDPTTWSTYSQVMRVVGRYDGISIAVEPPYCGVDLDGCYHGGVLAEWAEPIVTKLGSYSEVTPSGQGLRVWLRGQLSGRGRNRRGLGPDGEGAVEVYDRSRFFTITGNHLSGTPETIEPRQPQLDWLLATYLPSAVLASVPAPPAESIDLDDHEIVRRACAATNGARFSALWRGDASGYPSRSEADFALAASLAFWTGRDVIRMDRLFRASGLMRPKWDQRRGADTYGALTLARACVECQATYAPRRMRGTASRDCRQDVVGPLPGHSLEPTTETVTIWVG
jgi:putative DNA primase/helicase